MAEYFICEGCDLRGIHKDEDGQLSTAHQVGEELEWRETTVKKL